MPQTLSTISISLRVENTYEDGDEVVTFPKAEIPAPPTDSTSQEFEDWAYEHIYSLTGTGRTEGDSWYDVTVLECSDPLLVGRQFEWGY